MNIKAAVNYQFKKLILNHLGHILVPGQRSRKYGRATNKCYRKLAIIGVKEILAMTCKQMKSMNYTQLLTLNGYYSRVSGYDKVHKKRARFLARRISFEHRKLISITDPKVLLANFDFDYVKILASNQLKSLVKYLRKFSKKISLNSHQLSIYEKVDGELFDRKLDHYQNQDDSGFICDADSDEPTYH